MVSATAWWQPYADVVPSWFATYLTLEQTASNIRTHEPLFVPGLFQTPAYARAVISLTHTDSEDIERRVDLRRARQRLLEQAAPPDVRAVLDETALAQLPLTPSQRHAQLDHLIALTEQPNITLLIATPTAGLPATNTSFTVLHFVDPNQDAIVYLEQPDDARYLKDPVAVAEYSDIVDQLSIPHWNPDGTRAILRRIRAQV